MIHVKPYHLYESQIEEISLVDLCDSLLGDLPIWREAKMKINHSATVHIDTDGRRTAEAHFDRQASTPERVVIQMGGFPSTREDKGTLAHELVHALQWLTGKEGDLMFITDATRDLDVFSRSKIWKNLMFAIYLSCPQETESWKAESLYTRVPILDKILPWMKSFDPEAASEELLSLDPERNPWGMTSFSQLPQFWAEAYDEYDEEDPESEIPTLEGLTLEEFLAYYGDKFKAACQAL